MKEHKLPSGRVLRFPDTTSDDVVKATVNRIMNTKSDLPWSTEQVRAVVSEITAKNAEAVLDKNKIDHFGPAVEKLSVVINKAVEESALKTKTIHEKNNQAFLKSFSESIEVLAKEVIATIPDYSDKIDQVAGTISKTLTKEVVNVAAKIEMSSHTLNKNINSLIDAVNKNNEVIGNSVDLQARTLKVLDDLVKALKAKKKIIRDKSGNITAVDSE